MTSTTTATVEFFRLPHASDLPFPAYQSEHAAGLDLLAAVPAGALIVIAPGGRAAIPTGWAAALPPGKSGRGPASRSAVLDSPGTLDAAYRGEVQVILANFGDAPFTVKRGTAIATLVITPVARVAIRELAAAD